MDDEIEFTLGEALEAIANKLDQIEQRLDRLQRNLNRVLEALGVSHDE